MTAFNIQGALAGSTAGEVRTAAQDAAAFPRLATFNAGAVYVGRFSGQSPWERHLDEDELLCVLEGAVEITLLRADGRHSEKVPAGSIFVVPKAVWHRQLALPFVALLAVTPDRTDVSFDEDPCDPR